MGEAVSRSRCRAVLASFGSLVLLVAGASAAAGTAAGGPGAAGSRIVTYPVPAGQPRSADYSVKVRVPGGRWREVQVARVVVGLDVKTDSSLALLDASGPVEVAVTRTSGAIRSALVRPRAYGIEPVLSGADRTATFTLPRPLKVSFEVDGDRMHNLQLFVRPLDGRAPLAAGRRVIFFGPGLHTIPGDHVLDVPNDTTVELAGGALVRGAVLIRDAHDVVVRGRGILTLPDSRWAPSVITVQRSSRVGIEGVTILGSHVTGVDLYDARAVTIASLGEINSDLWSDGIDIQASSGVLVDDSFLRTSDDSIAVFASRWGYLGDTRDVAIRNTTLWADVAHPVLIGTHGDPERGDTIEEVSFQGLDILEHNEDNELYQGAMAVNAGDGVAVRSVRFDHVRVDDFSLGQLVNVQVFLNPDYNKKPGRAVSGILFRDVSYAGGGARASQITGFDPTHVVSNVVFENLTENGHLVTDAANGGIVVGGFVSGLVFRTQPHTVGFDDASPQIRYRGTWSSRSESGFRNGKGHVAARVGSSLSFGFRARQARILGLTSPASGRASVYVDGKLRATIDAYSTVRRAGQILFDTGVLAPGSHRLELRVLGQRGVLSSGKSIAVDGVESVA